MDHNFKKNNPSGLLYASISLVTLALIIVLGLLVCRHYAKIMLYNAGLGNESPRDVNMLVASFILLFVLIILYFGIITVIEHRTIIRSRNYAYSIEYMHHIGSTLSNAAMDPSRITDALDIIAKQYSGSSASFVLVKYGKVYDVFSTESDFINNFKKIAIGVSLKNNFPDLYSHLLNGDCAAVILPKADSKNHMDDLSAQVKAGKIISRNLSTNGGPSEESGPDDIAFEQLSTNVVVKKFRRTSVFNYMKSTSQIYVPVRSSTNNLTGILFVSDPVLSEDKLHDFRTYEYITSVASDFGMVSASIEAYALIKDMGTVDFTTGLLNRNAYMKAVKDTVVPDGEPLAVIFIDVNGLHEMNNTYGHDKGDQMLFYIAETLKDTFPDDEVFRIGGDEFLVIARDHSMSVIDLRITQVNSRIAQAHYAISIGVEWREYDHDLPKMIKAADLKMYADKKHYYETVGKGRDRRSRDYFTEADQEDNSSDTHKIFVTPSYRGPDRRRSQCSDDVVDIQELMDKYRSPSDGKISLISEIFAESEISEKEFEDSLRLNDSEDNYMGIYDDDPTLIPVKIETIDEQTFEEEFGFDTETTHIGS